VNGAPRTKLRFEAVRREDVAAVVEIERRSFAKPWSTGLFLHELKVPFSRSVAAWTGPGRKRRLVGYVCRWLVGDEIHILNLAVDPDCREQGIGRALVELVLEEAQDRQIPQVTLEVRAENAPARALYRKLGFAECGHRRNYYGRDEDAIIMSWSAPTS
jgi:[ribosomal protein S18]-alanine N-acetyltransferase